MNGGVIADLFYLAWAIAMFALAVWLQDVISAWIGPPVYAAVSRWLGL